MTAFAIGCALGIVVGLVVAQVRDRWQRRTSLIDVGGGDVLEVAGPLTAAQAAELRAEWIRRNGRPL